MDRTVVIKTGGAFICELRLDQLTSLTVPSWRRLCRMMKAYAWLNEDTMRGIETDLPQRIAAIEEHAREAEFALSEVLAAVGNEPQTLNTRRKISRAREEMRIQKQNKARLIKFYNIFKEETT